jgi:FkbM family methyltransferase
MTPDATNTLRIACANLGHDEAARTQIVRACVETEKRLARMDFNVREEITGPIVDALYADVDSIAVELDNGLVVEVKYRSKIARDIVMRDVARPDHVFEPQTTKLLLHLSKGVQNVLIGGAYAGDHAVLVAKQIAGSNGIVHAFEPNPEQMEMLKKNATRNELHNIRFVGDALWDAPGVRLGLVGNDAFASVAPVEAGGFMTTTIDEYGAGANVKSLDVIMLDIEGSELRALKGAAGFLGQPAGRAPAIIYEINRGYVDWSDGLERTDIVSYLAGHGYTSYCVRDYQTNITVNGPVELVPVDDVYLEGPPHGFNMLAVKDSKMVDSPFYRITPGLSPKLLTHRDPRLHAPGG